MAGTVVHSTNIDSVRIEIIGTSRAVTIPCELILAVDALFRQAALEDAEIEIESDDGQWTANVSVHDSYQGEGNSPWSAVLDWAKENK